MSYFVASEGALETGAAVVGRKRSISRCAALTLAALSRRLLGTSSTVALGLVLATIDAIARHRLDRRHLNRLVHRRQLVGRRCNQRGRREYRHGRAQCHSGRSGRRASEHCLCVGISGTGTLTIQSGGNFSDFNGYVGFQCRLRPAPRRLMAPARPGPLPTCSLSAIYGTGTLTIQNGGTVSNTNIGLIGSNVGSTGTVTVDGAGSAWTNSTNLAVGNSGTGTLTIRNGGTVSSALRRSRPKISVRPVP